MTDRLPWQELAAKLSALVLPVRGHQGVVLHNAAGRILASDAIATKPIPAFDHAVMDGFAIGSTAPGTYRLKKEKEDILNPDEAFSLAAGSPVPRQTAAVILAHHATVSEGRLHVALNPRRDNVRRAGEEAGIGDIVLRAGTRLDVRHCALAAAAGLTELTVCTRPRVAILGLDDSEGSLPHFTILSEMLTTPRLSLTSVGIVRSSDIERQLTALAQHHDLVVVVAESLRGEDGALFKALYSAGGKAQVCRAALKPAKPVISGYIGRTQIIGLAGTAYATVTAAHLFLRPMLMRLVGLPDHSLSQPATSGFSRSREPGRAEVLPVQARTGAGGLILTLAGGFGQLRALAAMDGMALVEAGQGDITPESEVMFMPVQMPLI